jgi:L-ascorbate metabolism protein UlaG (beta-lactamase superfamily)
MATVRLELNNVPARTTEAQIRQALSPLGRVIAVRKSGSAYVVEMDGTTVLEAIDSSGIGEIRLGDMRQIDSSGIGELSGAILRRA